MNIDIVAWWGAIIATLVLVWDIFKWSSTGPKLRIKILSNMVAIEPLQSMDLPKQVIIEVTNIGDSSTTITKTGLNYYKNWLQKILNRPEETFIIKGPITFQPLPHVLEQGKIWSGSMNQTDALKKMSEEGILMCLVKDSWDKKSHMKRIVFNKE